MTRDAMTRDPLVRGTLVRGTLAGLRILILRAARPDDPLATRLTAAGAEVQSLPVLRIEPVVPAGAVLARAATAAAWIFVSRHAVQRGAAALAAAGLQPAAQEIYAVGAATAAAVRETFGRAVGYPADPTSEGLLRLPGLQTLAGRSVAIFRGVGGRELLGETLAARGALVGYCELYRRVPETRRCEEIQAELTRPGPLLVVAHSGAVVGALSALVDLTVRPEPLRCLVPGARVAALARAAGLDPLVAEGALAEQMEQAVCRWYTPAR